MSAPDGLPAPRLRVNPLRCDAAGYCAEVLPELITLDEWGFPILSDTKVPGSLASHARRAADACPTLAILFSGEKKA